MNHASIRRGLEIDPTSNGITFYYGVCLAVLGKHDEAIQQFKKLSELDPTLSLGSQFSIARLRLEWRPRRCGRGTSRSQELDGKPEGEADIY